MKRRPFIFLGLLLWLPALAAPTDDSGPPADILAVRNIEIIFHTAGSVLPSKDLDLMMSLYADDVVLTDTAHENKVYRGKEQVRTYWADVSGPFRPEHHWIGYTPAMRIKSHVTGDTGTLDSISSSGWRLRYLEDAHSFVCARCTASSASSRRSSLCASSAR